MTLNVRRSVLAATLALAVSLGVAACGDDDSTMGDHDGHTMSGATTPASTPAAAPSSDAAAVDAAFIRQMIPHHEMAVEMAEDVKQTAKHDQITDLADDVIKAQTAEIAELKAKAKELGVDVAGADDQLAADAKTLGLAPDELGMSAHMGMSDELSERAFIDEMIVHHQGAIAMAKAQLQAGEDADLRKISTAIVAAQQREIEQLEAWRDQWYGGEPVDGVMPPEGAHGGEHGDMNME